MNNDEKIARNYLLKIKAKNIEFEPNGNIPPDFAIKRNIGIEVRRLNKYFNNEPLEQLEFGELRKIVNFIENFVSQKHFKNTQCVSVRYSRPLKFIQVKTKIREVLNQYSKSTNEIFEYNIHDNFSMNIREYSERLGSDFEVLFWVDHNRGGVVIDDLSKNIVHALKEKEKKIAPYFNQYKDWWLILINHISTKIRPQELEILKTKITKSKIFKKIIILEMNESSETIINCRE